MIIKLVSAIAIMVIAYFGYCLYTIIGIIKEYEIMGKNSSEETLKKVYQNSKYSNLVPKYYAYRKWDKKLPIPEWIREEDRNTKWWRL